jgi:hypothetical protein
MDRLDAPLCMRLGCKHSAEMAAKDKRIAELEAIVEKYARHDGLCGIVGGYGYCTCGLDAARKALTP